MKLFSPAKANLFFKVLFKRKDGYHEIASLYLALNFGDILSVKLSDEDRFRCDNLDLEFNSSNLIFKAYELYKRKTKLFFHVDMVLDKRIPMQAGLGGGSSNAATALYGINQLLGRPLSNEELVDLGKEIGSDVAFFFSAGSAFCSGRGEIFKDVPFKKSVFYLAVPSFGVATPYVYKNVDISSLSPSDPEMALLSFYCGDLLLFNDLEKAAFAFEPRLLDVKERLEKMGFDRVVMTGSGSAFLCFGEIDPPFSSAIRFFKTENIFKNSNSWYSLP